MITNLQCVTYDLVVTFNMLIREREMGRHGIQTFSSGYTVLVQTAHLSTVPENIEDSLLGVLPCTYKEERV